MGASLSLLLPTLWRLGARSVVDVAIYRLVCKSGGYRRLLKVKAWLGEDVFFTPPWPGPLQLSVGEREALLARADEALSGSIHYFSRHLMAVGAPPDWFLDPFVGERQPAADHWSVLNEFSGADIKKVWEASRFEWAPLFARAWRLTGDRRYLDALNDWTLDWARKNPVNCGPNWKCGQEASIRTINLLLAARLIGVHRRPSPSLVELIARHCARILPTIRYAAAQDNNHGTSEAAALFIGGGWLKAFAAPGRDAANGERWERAGRQWLENRVGRLIGEDGSFSQYSTNYHRVVLDTLSQVEVWRRELAAEPFSGRYDARCRAAVRWLASMTEPDTGGVPNLGANDGALLYDLSSSPYRDFRPSVQLAARLFLGARAFGRGEWDSPLSWLGLDEGIEEVQPTGGDSVIHRDGGDVVLSKGQSKAVIRFASFRFRPSHADCLHLDLWHRGRNILRDGGTYSYNTEQRWLDYFSGTASHNTVQFDGRNQMPRLGRFLFGAWLRMDSCSDLTREGGAVSWSGSYTDWKKASHRRTVSGRGNHWRVVDEVCGFLDSAILRWRLIPGQWSLAGSVCRSSFAELAIVTDAPLRRLELVTGWESLHYQEMSELPVLEVEVGRGHWTITTEVALKD